MRVLRRALSACGTEVGSDGGGPARPREAQRVPDRPLLSGTWLRRSAGPQGRRALNRLPWRRLLCATALAWAVATAHALPAQGPGQDNPSSGRARTDAPALTLDARALRATLSVRPWGPEQERARATLLAALDQLAQVGSEAVEPELQGANAARQRLALAEVYLWLLDYASAEDAAPAFERAEAALSATEAILGADALFAALLDRAAGHALRRHDFAAAQRLLRSDRVERAVDAGHLDALWTATAAASLALDSGRYGAAKELLDQAAAHTDRHPGDAGDLLGVRIAALRVLLETERGRVDWARAALAEQRERTRRLAQSTQESTARRNELRTRLLLLSELRIDNARGAATSALARAGGLVPRTPAWPAEASLGQDLRGKWGGGGGGVIASPRWSSAPPVPPPPTSTPARSKRTTRSLPEVTLCPLDASPRSTTHARSPSATGASTRTVKSGASGSTSTIACHIGKFRTACPG